MIDIKKRIIVESSYCKIKVKLIFVVSGLLVIDKNINGGSTMKKAKRAKVLPFSSENQPILHVKLPKNIITKKGVVIVRISITGSSLYL